MVKEERELEKDRRHKTNTLDIIVSEYDNHINQPALLQLLTKSGNDNLYLCKFIN